MSSLASITKSGDSYILDMGNRQVTVNVADIRLRLGKKSDTLAQLETKANTWLLTQSDGAEVLQIHIFGENPPRLGIGRFYKGNTIPVDWWAE